MDDEDAKTIAALEVGISQLDAGLGIPLEDVRRKLVF
jgi:hypothetical protein